MESLSNHCDKGVVGTAIFANAAERIRKLKFKIRYHNGQLANFGVFNYSFMLELTLQVPQILRTSTSIVVPPPTGR